MKITKQFTNRESKSLDQYLQEIGKVDLLTPDMEIELAIRIKKGDMFAQVAVETPVHLTAEQREMLEKFDESLRSGGDKHSPRAGGWLDTVKRFFERISS